MRIKENLIIICGSVLARGRNPNTGNSYPTGKPLKKYVLSSFSTADTPSLEKRGADIR